MKNLLTTVTAPVTIPVNIVLLGVFGAGDGHYASFRGGAVDVLRTVAFLICAPIAIIGFLALLGINRVLRGTSGLN